VGERVLQPAQEAGAMLVVVCVPAGALPVRMPVRVIVVVLAMTVRVVVAVPILAMVMFMIMRVIVCLLRRLRHPCPFMW
jgi:hypothetical protein